jgi:putative ABC transport system permease protein
VLSNFNRASSGYFQTMSMPLIAGRDFNSHDTLSSPPVAVVDKLFVARFLHGENPLGRSFHTEVGPGEKPQHFQIIGLVNNAKYGDLQRGLEPTVYLDEEQDLTPSSGQAFVVHSNLALAPATSAIRSAMEEIDPHSTIQFKAMPSMIYDLVRREDVMASLSSIFGILAVVLATVGLYGVMSFIVAQRRNEIGIRMAVGASGREIIKLMLRQSAVLLLVGLIAGTALSLLAGRAAKSLLFELQPNDPATILSAIFGLMLVTAFATLIPARRAASLDPMTALREE